MRKRKCEKCGGIVFKNVITTYPLEYFGKQIMVNRVAVKKCQKCQTMIPTSKGKEKLARCINAFSKMIG